MARTIAVKLSAGLGILIAVAAAGVAGEREYSWQKPHAEVVATGDLKWKPEPFPFVRGASARYIDFESGDDTRAGNTPAQAWKHHPWDAAARALAAACKGTHTYLFKRGVVYRGSLVARESGTAAEPIRLTSDPAWGTGEAVICGSQVVTGWKRGADHKDIPEPQKVWQADLDFAPRCLWMVDGGKVTRIALARTPNWTVSDGNDVQGEWWTWENPNWWKAGGEKTQGKSGRVHLGIDTRHLTGPAEQYVGAYVWSGWGIVMGTPFAARVEAYDPARKAIAFQGPWGGESGVIIRNNRYYLEDKPHFLDEPGEFWFDKRGPGGRLFVRLPGDRDPSGVTIEAARHVNLIDSANMSHVHVSGLTFRFTNVFWDLGARHFVHKDVDGACVRMLGSGRDLRVNHCRFEHVAKAVRLKAVGNDDRIDDVVVADNDIESLDHGAIEVEDGSGWAVTAANIGRLGRVEVLRNRLHRVGLRPIRSGHGHAVVVSFPETAEIAGNMLHRCYGAGLFIFGGKASGNLGDRPLGRILIHHNRVVDPLLNTNDWGGIETWQGGSFYVYNNLSGNPGGYWNCFYNPAKPGSARFGHAYYLDGSFQNYYFNNIAWGKSNDPASKLCNTSAFQQIISYQNTFFHNTVYNFLIGTRRQAPQAGRDKYISNVWQDLSQWVFRDADPAKTAAEANAADAGDRKGSFDVATDAYTRNAFAAVKGNFGVFEPTGRWHETLESFAKALAEQGALAAQVGTLAGGSVLADPAKYDFRPAPQSPALGAGSKVFVPWGLFAVVGEWHFQLCPNDPARIVDEHWYMTPYHIARDDYYTRPMYPLRGVNISAESFVTGDLEDWTAGALKLNGKDQYAMIRNADLAKPFTYEVKGKAKVAGGWVTVTAPTRVAPGQKFDVTLKLARPVPGQKIVAHLHWIKPAGFGGFNAWGGHAQDADRTGPLKFTFTPEDKPDLSSFLLTVFLSPDGDWSKQTRVVRADIAKAPAAEALEMKTATLGGDGETTDRVEIAGEALKNPQIYGGSFLIEAYFKTEPGHTGGAIVSKSDGRKGYELFLDGGGAVTFMVRGAAAVSAGTRTKVNDGKWHHVIAERDVGAGDLRVYLDGKMEVDLGGEQVGGSLANDADLLVGKGPQRGCFAGELDFLRIALGTLADAKTTIEELYAWQFDGPQFRDFTGRTRQGRTDAGAIEARK